jgi:hypothetical protein
MSATEIAGYCLAAFGIGYAVGYGLLLLRRAFEVID